MQYREKNKERIRARQRKYYHDNKETILAYRKKNMTKILQYQKEYKKRKKQEKALQKIETLKGKKVKLQAMIRKTHPKIKPVIKELQPALNLRNKLMIAN